MSDTSVDGNRSPDKGEQSPDRLCLTLWLDGFLNAGFYISVSLYWLPLFAMLLIGRSENGSINLGLVVLQKGVMVFSLSSLAFILLLVLARYVYHLLRRVGFLVILFFFCLFVLCFRYYRSIELRLLGIDVIVLGASAAILSTLLLLFITVLELVRSIEPEKVVQASGVENKISLRARIKKFVSNIFICFLTGNWVPDLRAKIEEIYHANERLKSEKSNIDDKFLADITSDFKAWTDATKFLLTVIGGLGVLVAVFSFRADEQSALRIIVVLFLLVPGLSCAYMEVFRRRCERVWKTLEEKV